MNKSIAITLNNFENAYYLKEKKDGGITVRVPFIDKDDEGVTVLEHDVVEVEKGKKADVIKQFFEENSTTIVREKTAYNINSIIYDEISLPTSISPDIITD